MKFMRTGIINYLINNLTHLPIAIIKQHEDSELPLNSLYTRPAVLLLLAISHEFSGNHTLYSASGLWNGFGTPPVK